MRKRIVSKTSRKNAGKLGNQNFKYGSGQFTFYNEDTYNGEYKFHLGQILLLKQGKGVYTTDNFDVYDGEWNDDTFADSDVHIRYK